MKYPARHQSIRDQYRHDLREYAAPMIIETREKARQAQGCVCPYCLKRLGRNLATLDHVMPVSRGGIDGPGNVLATCWDCNQAKGDDLPNGCALVWVVAINARLGWLPDIWEDGT